MWLGDSAGFELLHHVLELPVDVAGVPPRRGERGPLDPQPDVRDAPRVAPTRTASPPAGPRDRLLPDEIEATEAFTAEHVFPWMWEEYGGLRAQRDAAHLLAEHPWPRMADAAALAGNEVPVAATIYVDDVYVERTFAEETAALVRGLRPWITNEYAHNGLRADGERVVGRLIDMVKGRA